MVTAQPFRVADQLFVRIEEALAHAEELSKRVLDPIYVRDGGGRPLRKYVLGVEAPLLSTEHALKGTSAERTWSGPGDW
jgi:hypothetical protein